MIKSTRHITAPIMMAALAVLPLSGCDDGALGGGGRIEPSVRVLVVEQEGEGGADEEVVEVAGYGTFTGRVVLSGPMPAVPEFLPPGELKDSAVCIRAQIPNENLIVDASGGIQNVFLFLGRKPPGTPADLSEPPSAPVIFDQKVCTFLPHALVLQAEQEVRVLNSDGVAHNTHTKPDLNAEFNQTVGINESTGIPFTYARPERSPVRVVCDFHPWMLAWHLPLDHPYGAVTAEDGTFTIENIPAGTHRFAIWHEGRKLTDYPVTINPDETTTAEIPFDGSQLIGRFDPKGTRTVVIPALPQL